MTVRSRYPWALVASVGLVAGTACNALLTGPPDDADLFDAPLPGLTPEQLATFARGDAEFGRQFTPADGLGPIFNARACADCHSGDGRGRPENILIRISRGGDLAEDVGGPQIQDKAIPGATPEVIPAGVDMSPRLPPPVFGVGLIEAIPASAILANADPTDSDNDGISGRPNLVTPPAWVPSTEPGGGGGVQLGRFSRKGQVSTLLEQTVAAYHQDMGVTSDFLPVENRNPQVGGVDPDGVADPEVPEDAVRAVVDYIRMLAAPAPAEDTPAIVRGRELFTQIGCAACHIPTFQTGDHPIAALANQTVTLYSDLLLHDMGGELADDRPDGDADGREWKTPPLWGLRIARDFLNGDLFLMHDGRAGTVERAIELHGGEGADARDAFAALSADDREALLAFVRTR